MSLLFLVCYMQTTWNCYWRWIALRMLSIFKIMFLKRFLGALRMDYIWTWTNVIYFATSYMLRKAWSCMTPEAMHSLDRRPGRSNAVVPILYKPCYTLWHHCSKWRAWINRYPEESTSGEFDRAAPKRRLSHQLLANSRGSMKFGISHRKSSYLSKYFT